MLVAMMSVLMPDSSISLSENSRMRMVEDVSRSSELKTSSKMMRSASEYKARASAYFKALVYSPLWYTPYMNSTYDSLLLPSTQITALRTGHSLIAVRQPSQIDVQCTDMYDPVIQTGIVWPATEDIALNGVIHYPRHLAAIGN